MGPGPPRIEPNQCGIISPQGLVVSFGVLIAAISVLWWIWRSPPLVANGGPMKSAPTTEPDGDHDPGRADSGAPDGLPPAAGTTGSTSGAIGTGAGPGDSGGRPAAERSPLHSLVRRSPYLVADAEQDSSWVEREMEWLEALDRVMRDPGALSGLGDVLAELSAGGAPNREAVLEHLAVRFGSDPGTFRALFKCAHDSTRTGIAPLGARLLGDTIDRVAARDRAALDRWGTTDPAIAGALMRLFLAHEPTQERPPRIEACWYAAALDVGRALELRNLADQPENAGAVVRALARADRSELVSELVRTGVAAGSVSRRNAQIVGSLADTSLARSSGVRALGSELWGAIESNVTGLASSFDPGDTSHREYLGQGLAVLLSRAQDGGSTDLQRAERVFGALMSAADPVVRSTAIASAGRLCHIEPVAEQLLRVVEDEARSDIDRMMAATALTGRVQSSRIVERMLRVAERPASDRLRRSVVAAVRRLEALRATAND
jgi:hypothetical protein